MKLKKLMESLNEFLDADRKTQLKEINSIRKVLKELKKKERKLKEELKKLSAKQEDEKDELQIKLDVIYAQRKKGLERVKELKKELQKN
jgi:DNA repair exonuclease SbcCD ATPase subunit